MISFLLLVLSAGPPTPEYRIGVRKVYDGDTIVADVDLGLGTALLNRKIRIYGFDAWELTRHRQTVEITDEELEKGSKAKAALHWLVTEWPDRVYFRPEGDGFGVYGRLEGRLIIYPRIVEPIDVAEYLKERGHDRGPRTKGSASMQLSPEDDDLEWPD